MSSKHTCPTNALKMIIITKSGEILVILPGKFVVMPESNIQTKRIIPSRKVIQKPLPTESTITTSTQTYEDVKLITPEVKKDYPYSERTLGGTPPTEEEIAVNPREELEKLTVKQLKEIIISNPDLKIGNNLRKAELIDVIISAM